MWVKLLSRVWLFATPWTVAYQAPPSWDSPAKNIEVGSQLRNRLPSSVFLGFPCGSAGKESAWNEGDLGSIPGLGRFPGEGKSYPLQYSDLEDSMDYTVVLDTIEQSSLSHQGCILSPWLFNFYAEYIMWNARLDESEAGINISRKKNISITSHRQIIAL